MALTGKAKSNTSPLAGSGAPVAGTRLGRFFSRPLGSAHAAGQRMLRPATRALMTILAAAVVWTAAVGTANAGSNVDLTIPPGYGMTAEQITAAHDAYIASLTDEEKAQLDSRIQAVEEERKHGGSGWDFAAKKAEKDDGHIAHELNRRYHASINDGDYDQQRDWRAQMECENNAWRDHGYNSRFDAFGHCNGPREISSGKAGRIVLKSIHKYFKDNPEAMDRYVPDAIARIARMDTSEIETMAADKVEDVIGDDGMSWVKRMGIDDGFKFAFRTAKTRKIELYENENYKLFGTEGHMRVYVDDIGKDGGAVLRAKFSF